MNSSKMPVKKKKICKNIDYSFCVRVIVFNRIAQGQSLAVVHEELVSKQVGCAEASRWSIARSISHLFS